WDGNTLPLPTPPRQALVAIEPIHPFRIDLPYLAVEQNVQASVAGSDCGALPGSAVACAALLRPHGDAVASAWCAGARPPRDTPVAARTRRSLAHSPQLCAGLWASPVWCRHVLQGALVQRQIRHHLLALAVLVLELA